ncbi:MAG TPA: class I SAM-dependent methyltransferase [Nitrospiraceae bacterium]|nr:class I SAM-dependent methyltransferase [Nitrospiraceae bacterium]
MPRESNDGIRRTLHDHLSWWGLKHFTSDAEYFGWQRENLSSADLNRLNQQVERKRAGDCQDEIAFYDLTADPRILPVLYSQRYEYYREISSRVAAHVKEAKTILDFGCGVGILTTFYARQFPNKQFLGIDRSHRSMTMANEQAHKLNLTNVRFECIDIECESLSGLYDLIVATHAIVQAEQDPGIPSQSWQTFERAREAREQSEFEQRTGIGVRLDRLAGALAANGHMCVFEKTRQLARRIPLQRAFAARGLRLLEKPEPIRYSVIEDVADDGPFYVLTKGQGNGIAWNELPEPDEGAPFDRANSKPASTDPDTPLYENHCPSAQGVWQGLKGKEISKETTRQEQGGRQFHVELGTSEQLSYLYCANTFDQRQLVIVEPARAAMLETYYQEIIRNASWPQLKTTRARWC